MSPSLVSVVTPLELEYMCLYDILDIQSKVYLIPCSRLHRAKRCETLNQARNFLSHVSMKLYAGGLRNLHVAISEY